MPENIVLNTVLLTIKVGESFKLLATALPYDCTDPSITWSNDSPDVVSLDGGQVLGLAPGNAIITATTSNGINGYCTITVESPEGSPESIDLDITNVLNYFNIQSSESDTNGNTHDFLIDIIKEADVHIEYKTTISFSFVCVISYQTSTGSDFQELTFKKTVSFMDDNIADLAVPVRLVSNLPSDATNISANISYAFTSATGKISR